MVIAILENLTLIAERLVELIKETDKSITFHHAASYDKGLLLLNEHRPAVILLDLKFAGNNIVDLLIKIKALNDKAIVIVLFSVHDEQKLAQCKTHGADYILDKYHEFEKIPEIISNIINDNRN